MNGPLPRPVRYRVRVASRLDPRWADWFAGFVLVAEEDATTTLTGDVADQAELHGLLSRIRDLGLDLISLEAICGCPPTPRRSG